MPCLAPASGRLSRRPFVLVVLLLGTLLVPASAGAAGPETDAVESDLLSRVNALRGTGVPPLASHPQLAAAAHAQAAWLAAMSPDAWGGLSAQQAHCGGPGCPARRAADAGWPDPRSSMGEVVRFGDRTGTPGEANARTVTAWDASAYHREQLRRASWRFAGAAIVGEVAVVVFADPCTVPGCVGGSAPTALSEGAGGTAPASGGSASRVTGPAVGATPGSATARRTAPSCMPRGRIQLRRTSRRRALEVRVICRTPGRRYTAKVRDGRRRRTVALRRERTVVRVPASRRARWVRVSIVAAGRPMGSARVRVPGA